MSTFSARPKKRHRVSKPGDLTVVYRPHNGTLGSIRHAVKIQDELERNVAERRKLIRVASKTLGEEVR